MPLGELPATQLNTRFGRRVRRRCSQTLNAAEETAEFGAVHRGKIVEQRKDAHAFGMTFHAARMSAAYACHAPLPSSTARANSSPSTGTMATISACATP